MAWKWNGRRLNALAAGCVAALAGCGSSNPGNTVSGTVTDANAAGLSAKAGDCASLLNFKPSVNTVITRAESIDASAAAPWLTPTNVMTPAAQQVTTPFCRVAGVVKPSEKSSINFEVWLPLPAAWNRKFVGNADGGSTGAIFYAYMTDPLQRGYAVMGHDNGHVSKDPFEQSWAFDSATNSVNIDAITDFGYRAQHVVTVVSKELSGAYYAAAPVHAYYNGCSQGGHHGMMEVQRYPDDYDGAVAGAHGGDWLGMMSSEAWAAVSVLKNNRAGGLTVPQLTAFHAAVLSACDANDGLVDGQIGDPRQCKFDPATLQCGAAGADPATCMSPAQVQATRDIFAGPKRSGNGESVSPPYARGSEGGWSTTWNAATIQQSGSYNDFFKLILKQDPSFDIVNLNWDSDIDAGRAKYGTIYDANNADLSAFKANKGKLIMYHGWSDPLISPFLSLNYWTRLQDTMGAGSLNDFARLFMVPDMGPLHRRSGRRVGLADAASAKYLKSSPSDGAFFFRLLIGEIANLTSAAVQQNPLPSSYQRWEERWIGPSPPGSASSLL